MHLSSLHNRSICQDTTICGSSSGNGMQTSMTKLSAFCMSRFDDLQWVYLESNRCPSRTVYTGCAAH
eukprot:m.343653 g.343653  ORF g.343653 m.343653 type:complete len:67 (-) comp20634_c2_seq7:1987-2187(-)